MCRSGVDGMRPVVPARMVPVRRHALLRCRRALGRGRLGADVGRAALTARGRRLGCPAARAVPGGVPTSAMQAARG